MRNTIGEDKRNDMTQWKKYTQFRKDNIVNTYIIEKRKHFGRTQFRGKNR
jgi:hypothetical protein